jgi:hypothetical protein
MRRQELEILFDYPASALRGQQLTDEGGTYYSLGRSLKAVMQWDANTNRREAGGPVAYSDEMGWRDFLSADRLWPDSELLAGSYRNEIIDL